MPPGAGSGGMKDDEGVDGAPDPNGDLWMMFISLGIQTK